MPRPLSKTQESPQETLSDDVVYKLAINFDDAMGRLDPKLRANMVSCNVSPELVEVDKLRPTVRGLVFKCSLLTAATVCDVIRNLDRQAGDSPTRIYLKRDTAWWPVPGADVLTEKRDGKIVLNTEVFKRLALKLEVVPITPPNRPYKVVKLGRSK